MRLPGSHSRTRSIIRIGKRCGRCESTWWISMSTIALLLLLDPFLEGTDAIHQVRELPHHRGIAGPGFVLIRREHAGVGAGLADRARNHGICRHMGMIADRKMPEDQRAGADGAMAADVGAARDR